MTNNKIIIDHRQGPFLGEPCPFGGRSRVIMRERKDGILIGKCELAERIKMELKEAGIFEGVFGPDLEARMKRNGCPHPPHYSFFSWRRHCKYNYGDWVEV